MNFLNPFSRQGAQWTLVGRTSEFPDVDDDAGNLAKHRVCNTKSIPGCKAFHIPKEDVSSSKEVEIGDDALGKPLTDEVLIFQYKGKFHAVDHVSKYQNPWCMVTDKNSLVHIASFLFREVHLLILRTLVLRSVWVFHVLSMTGLLIYSQACLTVVVTSLRLGRFSSEISRTLKLPK